MLILLAGRVNLISAHRPLPLSPIASSLQPSHTDYIHPLKIKNKLAELENIEKLNRARSSKDERSTRSNNHLRSTDLFNHKSLSSID